MVYVTRTRARYGVRKLALSRTPFESDSAMNLPSQSPIYQAIERLTDSNCFSVIPVKANLWFSEDNTSLSHSLWVTIWPKSVI